MSMRLTIPTGVRLPEAIRLRRKELVFLENSLTGEVLPVILTDREGHEAPNDQDIKHELELMGYRELPDHKGFELATSSCNQVHLPSVN